MLSDFIELANTLGEVFLEKNRRLVTAESCTGGWLAAVITAIAGSSNWFECGYVCYSNVAKKQMLGVSDETLQQYGAVSEPCAAEMALGALSHSGGDVSVAITGIAGPSGGQPDKAVGTVWFGFALSETTVVTERCQFSGNRQAVRQQAVQYSLARLLELLREEKFA